MAAVGRFPYAVNHLGALVLGNLLCAILFRNELWMRFLYMVAIYGLRGVCAFYLLAYPVLPFVISRNGKLMQVFLKCIVGSATPQAGGDFDSAARRWYSFRMRSFWHSVRTSFPEKQSHRLGPTERTNKRLDSWLVYTVVDVALESPLQHGAVIATGVITATFVIVSALSAFPWVRK